MNVPLVDVPPHLKGALIAASLDDVIVNPLNFREHDADCCKMKQLWPTLTDDERRLILGMSLLHEQGHVQLGKTGIYTWDDGEVWGSSPMIAEKIIHLSRRRRSGKHAANT